MQKEYNLGDKIYYISEDGEVRKDIITKKTTTIVESPRKHEESKELSFVYGIGTERILQKNVDNMWIFSSKEEAVKIAKEILNNAISLKEHELSRIKKTLNKFIENKINDNHINY